jgi:hypothetical protein
MSNFRAFFAFMGALTLVGEVLLAVEIDRVVVGRNCEDRIVEGDGSTGFASVDVINF